MSAWTPDEWTFLLGVSSSSEALQNFRRSCCLYLLDRIESQDEDATTSVPPMAFASRFIGEYNAFQRDERARQVICPSKTQQRLRFVRQLSSRGVIVHTPNRLIEYMRSLGLVLYFTACTSRPWLLGIEFYISTLLTGKVRRST